MILKRTVIITMNLPGNLLSSARIFSAERLAAFCFRFRLCTCFLFCRLVGHAILVSGYIHVFTTVEITAQATHLSTAIHKPKDYRSEDILPY